MQSKKTEQGLIVLSVNNSLTHYAELSDLELETVAGGKRGGDGSSDRGGRRYTNNNTGGRRG